MNVGNLTLMCVLLVAGQAPDETWPCNQRKVRFPIDIKPERRQEIDQVLLFVSADRGRTWNQEAVVTPDKGEFNFYAPADGEYWFRVATINREHRQEPADVYKGPPPQKILVDTQRPVIRLTAAERQGDEVAVAWEIQEDHPDLASLRLEYQTPDSPGGLWEQAAVNPGLNGQGRIRLSGPRAAKVRLQMKDVAGNQSVAEADVAGSPGITTAGFNLDSQLPPPAPVAGAAPVPPMPAETRPAPVAPVEPPAPMAVASAPPPPQAPPVQALPNVETVVRRAALPPAPPAPEGAQLVASSDAPPAPAVAAQPAAPPVSRELPALQVVNSTELTLDYELDKVGPSGVGKVELWLTEDDGKNWQRWAEDPVASASMRGGKYQRRVELPHEGVFGFRLVVLSKAGLGEPLPRAGDAPEMRVEVDVTPPRAQLYCQPDPQHENALLLRWECEDKNLTPSPVSLEWADRREGPWKGIAANLPANPGCYSWRLPPGVPVYVYLRLRVRDLAGNEAAAVTPTPQLADLAKPVGRLLHVAVTPRQ